MASDESKTAVITGGNGFLGSHLAKFLIKNGYEVYLIVRSFEGMERGLRESAQAHIVDCNLQDLTGLRRLLPDGPSVFFHFAWAGVSPKGRNDYGVQMGNINLSINAVRVAHEIHARKFILPGSTMEYAYYKKPIDRNAVPSPINAYGVAKISARYACSAMCRELGLPFIYTVISGIYSEDRQDDNVIYYTISKLLHKQIPSLTKLEQKWDYIHVDDVVYGLYLIAEKGKDKAFYPLGHGDNWRLADYILKIRDLIDPELPLGIGDIPYLNGDIPCSCVNLQELYLDTGFVPKIPFDEGIARVIEALKERETGG